MGIKWEPIGPEPLPGSGDWEQWNAEYHLATPEDNRCYYCVGELEYPYVLWGGLSLIGLHPECARRLGQHLIKDGLVADDPDGEAQRLVRRDKRLGGKAR